MTAQIRVTELLEAHQGLIDDWVRRGANPQELDAVVSKWYRMASGRIHADVHPVPISDASVLTVTFTPPTDAEVGLAEACYEKGIAVAQDGRLREALSDFMAASKLNPFNPIYLTAIGQAALELNDREEAESSLLNALSLDPKNATALQVLGNLRYWTGDKKSAIALYEASLRVEETPVALTNLGAALAHLGEYNRAASLFERALALDSHYEKAAVALRLISECGR